MNNKLKNNYVKQVSNLKQKINRYEPKIKFDEDSKAKRINIFKTQKQKEIAHSLLLSVKSDLNALYGINAMHLLHDRCRYNIYGMYVACYARSSLCYDIYKLLNNNNIEIYYYDTYSVKYKDDIKADKNNN